ncbi:uncharacterized protein LOC118563644 isoform X1 [Fundulus heteroclitus]|uniref:uncharacterized protein LOC118563644 isoform X1 n=1 Tax=Fundulus heteroclitus TaxID=8078 RepID=UPI00165C65FF|nr:uncharacterized protein LOC118563644 isoform X1 [Fundulus heteroclitus]
MTPPKQNVCCPLCHSEFTYIGKHLRYSHGIKNSEERKILIRFSNGRINIRKMPCPVDGCRYASTRLDMHIDQAHPEMEGERKAQVINGLKYQVTVNMLGALSATNPSPPMVSRLHMDPRAREEAGQHHPTSGPLDDDTSCTSCKELGAKNLQLTSDLGQLRKKLLYQHRWAKRAKKAIKRLEEDLQKGSTCPVPGVDVDVLVGSGSTSPDEEPQHITRPKSKQESRNIQCLVKAYPKFPLSILEYIAEYWQHLKGSHGLRKRIENQRSKVGRIMAFLSFITEGQTILQNWTFLPNMSRIYQWPEHLQNGGKAENTVKTYLVNLSQFLGYFRDTPPTFSRVPKREVFAVIRAISECIASLGPRVVMRQIRVKKNKLSRTISKDQLRLCKVLARRRIPELLDELSEDPNPEARRRFYGYLSVYLASLYGHRTGVLKNMTVSEVDEAQQEATVGQAGFVINVKEHKTNRAFGPAQLYLTVEEFSWVEQWMIIREKLNPPTDLLLFTENFTKIEKLIVPMQAAWLDMGFPGRPTFTDFRTSIATYARNTLSPSDRINISKTMCHHTRTADKFYALHRTASELARIRQNFEAAVKPPRTTVHDTAEPFLLSMSESSGDGLEEEADCGPSHSPPAGPSHSPPAGPSPSSPTSSQATGSTSPDQASGSCYSPGSASSQSDSSGSDFTPDSDPSQSDSSYAPNRGTQPRRKRPLLTYTLRNRRQGRSQCARVLRSKRNTVKKFKKLNKSVVM